MTLTMVVEREVYDQQLKYSSWKYISWSAVKL